MTSVNYSLTVKIAQSVSNQMSTLNAFHTFLKTSQDEKVLNLFLGTFVGNVYDLIQKASISSILQGIGRLIDKNDSSCSFITLYENLQKASVKNNIQEKYTQPQDFDALWEKLLTLLQKIRNEINAENTKLKRMMMYRHHHVAHKTQKPLSSYELTYDDIDNYFIPLFREAAELIEILIFNESLKSFCIVSSYRELSEEFWKLIHIKEEDL